jgi:hypothetical protein
MIRNKVNKIFTLFLLLYFVGFAVSPVSAIFPADQPEKVEARDFLEKRTTQSDLFFFDLALWDVLKKSKRSDNSKDILLVLDKDAAAKNNIFAICNSTIDDLDPLRLFLGLTQYHDTRLLSPYTITRFTHSGPSPPFSF